MLNHFPKKRHEITHFNIITIQLINDAIDFMNTEEKDLPQLTWHFLTVAAKILNFGCIYCFELVHQQKFVHYRLQMHV